MTNSSPNGVYWHMNTSSKWLTRIRKKAWTKQLIGAISENNKHSQSRQLLSDHSSITALKHIIDCDADPFNPWTKNGWTVEEHKKGGQWKFDPTHVEFFLVSDQKKNHKEIDGGKLRKELTKWPVFNANVLDYLLANPYLIPEEWKKNEQGNSRYIFFWGTVYSSLGGSLCVRYLFCYHGRWCWSHDWLDSKWNYLRPAAICTSQILNSETLSN